MKRTNSDQLDPWLALLLIASPLCIGGVPSWVVPPFAAIAALALAMWWWPSAARQQPVELPRGLGVFVFAAMWTALATIRWGDNAALALAPGPVALANESRALAALEPWRQISILPGATRLECVRLLALGACFALGSRCGWRWVARLVSLAALGVLGIGIISLALDSQSLLGVYTPIEVSQLRDHRWGLLSTFINPNHLGAYLSLSLLCSIALAVDDDTSPAGGRDARMFFTIAAALQLVGVVLSQSRGAIVVTGLALSVTAVLIVRTGRLGATRAAGRHGTGPSPRFLASVCAVTIALLALAGRPAWQQLKTLTATDAFSDKYTSVLAALDLVPGAWIVGSGRGTSVDLLGTVYTQGGVLVFTHIECAPVAMLVEWGIIGSFLLWLALLVAWMLVARRAASLSRKVLLVALIAYALNNLADFNWEFVGTSCAVSTLVGALVPHNERKLPTSLRLGLPLALLGLALSATMWTSQTWSPLRHQHLAHAAGELDDAQALDRRPLDARVHLNRARRQTSNGELEAALASANFAARIAPWSLDAKLVQAKLWHRQGRMPAALNALAAAFELVRPEERGAAVDHVCAAYQALELRELPQLSEATFYETGLEMLKRCPAHALMLAQARAARTSHEDPASLEIRARASVLGGRPVLAAYYARQWIALRPQQSEAHATYVDALRLSAAQSDDPAKLEREIRRHLLQALEQGPLDDVTRVQELVLWSARRNSTPAEKAELIARIGPSMLKHTRARADAKRRQRLLDTLSEAPQVDSGAR